jgi:hypothetical protein
VIELIKELLDEFYTTEEIKECLVKKFYLKKGSGLDAEYENVLTISIWKIIKKKNVILKTIKDM